MFDNIGKMVRFKNGIKMRMEGACEKDNLWRGVSVVMMDKILARDDEYLTFWPWENACYYQKDQNFDNNKFVVIMGW